MAYRASLRELKRKDPGGIESGLPRWKSELISTTLSGRYKSNDKYRIHVYGTISIQILVGKIQNCITA